MFEGLPAALHPPLDLALAKAVESIPRGDVLSGSSVFEMKFDGFRAGCLVGSDGAWLYSRQGKDLSRYFPDVLNSVREQIPPGVVVDGEVVAWSGGRLNFEALQMRLVSSRAALPELIRKSPASLVVFDVLAVAGQDTRGLQFRDRRALLEELARGWVPPLHLSPATHDRALAATWFDEMTATGVEGIVIKGEGQTYEPRRIWLKVKSRNALDVVLAAVIGPMEQPRAAVVGLPVDGRLRIVGRSAPLTARAGRDLATYLRPPRGKHPWPQEISDRVLDRFTKESGPVSLTLVEPLVVEVSADVAWSGRAFRHSVRLTRVRPELPPVEVTLPEGFA
ncbi:MULTISPECIES: ATP-dependent DNA ligase [Paenarthrobacter]|uniref:ATP-dependent DNA ligase n=1 Tax=Paenarthrobacter ureafaciens TaxID=37931 RepID=A0AAX3EED6_PAEUR|nr:MULTISPECIES: ATP-dependent DNA ligase [Paenarthrobacter]NKR13329.1 ATP-dependent DNA ligase [Arthrobacter sp. M5]NKR14821.1 ATP-dependent DNA ligase [Arthrobacter sp. M6]OEH62374.1 ATP-dependent DNA ligase [Arthrobacter sp. D4]OEH62945.1 ATP-dependent DNA ligase [Arthrobacter sp. D2]MDO5865119.1 ATP-dependent DNA ligase [Paenarthrobacter sp. SD-2]